MTFSPLTNHISRTGQYTPGRHQARPDIWIVHHAVSYSWQEVLRLMMGAKEVSANYIIGRNGELIGVVDEENTAWTSSSNFWDGRALTVEICNDSMAPDYSISAASQRTLERLMAESSTRHAFNLQRSGRTSSVIGHRELYLWFGASYATACPGGLPIDSVTAGANLIKSGAAAGPQEDEDDMKATIYRNAKTGEIAAMDATTGFDFYLPADGYREILARTGVVKSADFMNLPDNEFMFIRQLARATRGSVDTGALTKAIQDTLRGANLNVDAAALAASLTTSVQGVIKSELGAVPQRTLDTISAALADNAAKK